MTATYVINSDFGYNSIQITFDSIPDAKLRDKMKNQRFKWHKKCKYWYAALNDSRLKLAKSICKENPAEPKQEKAADPEKPKTEEPEKKNKYGVQVGDIFSCSWGYDQTNVDFFQVLKLCGEKSVRVRQVQPKMVEEKAESGMSATRFYEITREILPPTGTVFITDQENGDLKRLKSWAKDGVSDPIFEVGSGGYICHKEPLGKVEHFESWWR